jgi:hypothetical protein
LFYKQNIYDIEILNSQYRRQLDKLPAKDIRELPFLLRELVRAKRNGRQAVLPSSAVDILHRLVEVAPELLIAEDEGTSYSILECTGAS